MLAQLTQRLHAQRNFADAACLILDDIIALHGAEYGNIQLPIEDELVIAAQSGLSAAFLKTFKSVRKDSGCACGRALRDRSIVIVSDVDSDPEYAPFRQAAKMAQYRAVQSTPLFTRAKTFVGVLSTLFAQVHKPTPIEMQILNTYSVIAADHLYALRGERTLAACAKEMNERLYTGLA